MSRPHTLTEHAHTMAREGALEVHRFRLGVPADHGAFEGHFPGFELLPGVAQLSHVLDRCAALRPEWGAPERLARLKFSRPIRPSDTVELVLSLDDERRRAAFELLCDEGPCTTGRMVFANG